jgi:AAA15 family ATPase/GTPase
VVRLYKIHEKFEKGLLYLKGKKPKVYSYMDIQKSEQKIKSFDKYLNRHLLELRDEIKLQNIPRKSISKINNKVLYNKLVRNIGFFEKLIVELELNEIILEPKVKKAIQNIISQKIKEMKFVLI